MIMIYIRLQIFIVMLLCSYVQLFPGGIFVWEKFVPIHFIHTERKPSR